MRRHHWFDFETSVKWNDGSSRTVRVEALVSAWKGSDDLEIEGVKVKLVDTNVEVILRDDQMKGIYDEIRERCGPEDFD